MHRTQSHLPFQTKSTCTQANPSASRNEKLFLFKDQHDCVVQIKTSPQIENLVLSGGGVRGLIDIGAIKALEEYGLLNQISNIAGTSIGALIGTAISFGMNSHELASLMENLDFKSLLGSKTGRFIKRDGAPLFLFADIFIKKAIHNYFLKNTDPEKQNKCRSILNKLSNSKEITFQDLERLRIMDSHVFKTLHIKSYCIEKKQSVTFNSKSTPDLGIATACRASASLPVELKHTKIQCDLVRNLFQVDPTKETYSFADGGMNDNIPTDVFEEDVSKIEGEFDQNLKTLSFVFDDSADPSERSFFDTIHVNSTKIMHMGKARRFIANAAIRLDGIKLKEKYTTAKSKGLDDIRERYPFLSVPFKSRHIKANDYKKAKEQFHDLIHAGYDTLSSHIEGYFGSDLISQYHKTFDSLESFFLSLDDEEISSLFYNMEQYDEIFSSEEMNRIRNPHFRQILFYFRKEMKQDTERYFRTYQDENQRKTAENIRFFLCDFLKKIHSFEPRIDARKKEHLFDFMLKNLQRKIFKYDPGDGSKTILYLLNQKIYDIYQHSSSEHIPHGISKIARCIQTVWNEQDPEKNDLALKKVISIAHKAVCRSETSLIYDALMKYNPEGKVEFFRLFYFIF